jgi:hypothetical protein
MAQFRGGPPVAQQLQMPHPTDVEGARRGQQPDRAAEHLGQVRGAGEVPRDRVEDHRVEVPGRQAVELVRGPHQELHRARRGSARPVHPLPRGADGLRGQVRPPVRLAQGKERGHQGAVADPDLQDAAGRSAAIPSAVARAQATGRAHIEAALEQLRSQGAVNGTLALQERLEAEQVRDRFHTDALGHFALSPEADAEADLARAAKMRTRHLHSDTYEAAVEAADEAAEQARWRTAHHLLNTRLGTVRALAGERAAVPQPRPVRARWADRLADVARRPLSTEQRRRPCEQPRPCERARCRFRRVGGAVRAGRRHRLVGACLCGAQHHRPLGAVECRPPTAPGRGGRQRRLRHSAASGAAIVIRSVNERVPMASFTFSDSVCR